MRSALVLLWVAAGCRQVFGLDPPGHADAAPPAADVIADAAPDVLPTGTCIERWHQQPFFDAPTALAVASASGVGEMDPYTTDDELDLYFSRAGEIYLSQRAERISPFVTSAIVQSLNTAAAETKVSVTTNKLIVYFSSERTGGPGPADLWHGTRALVTDPWVIDTQFLDNINTAEREYDPHTSTDYLRMYLARYNGAAQTLMVASRPGTGMVFAAPVALTTLDMAGSESDPSLTDDELVIVFSSTGTGVRDLYYATRASMADPFGSPKPLTALNTTNFAEGGPHLSGDGCDLYFESNAAGSNDIYVVHLLGG